MKNLLNMILAIPFIANFCREHVPDERLLCHICAQRLRNRWALYQLIYHVRGTHTCEECGGEFSVRFEESAE